MRKTEKHRTLGIGIDITEVKRIERLVKSKKGFLKRIFTDEELEYSLGAKEKYQHLAARFAAKEAVWKALGLKNLALKDIGIIKSENGEPLVICKDKRTAKIDFLISLTHTRNYAAAMVVTVKKI